MLKKRPPIVIIGGLFTTILYTNNINISTFLALVLNFGYF